MPAFLLILAVVLAATGVAIVRLRQSRCRAEVKQMRALHEKERVLEFMRHLAEALAAKVDREELQVRIARAAALCTGATSACFYARTGANVLRPVAIEGLFPPQRPLADGTANGLETRAAFIEWVLRGEEIGLGEGLIGRIAQSGSGELLADAAGSPLVVRHADPALIVGSMIAVPLRFRGSLCGVLALAKGAAETRFSEADFKLAQNLGSQASLALDTAG